MNSLTAVYARSVVAVVVEDPLTGERSLVDFINPRFQLSLTTLLNKDTKKFVDWHTLFSLDSAMVLVLSKDRTKIAFIDQYRYATGSTHMGLMAGMFDLKKDKSIFDTAARELSEEGKLAVCDLMLLNNGPCTDYYDPSISSERQRKFIAIFSGKAAGELEENETIWKYVKWLAVDDVDTRMLHSAVTGAPFYNGLFLCGSSLNTLNLFFRLRNAGLLPSIYLPD